MLISGPPNTSPRKGLSAGEPVDSKVRTGYHLPKHPTQSSMAPDYTLLCRPVVYHRPVHSPRHRTYFCPPQGSSSTVALDPAIAQRKDDKRNAFFAVLCRAFQGGKACNICRASSAWDNLLLPISRQAGLRGRLRLPQESDWSQVCIRPQQRTPRGHRKQRHRNHFPLRESPALKKKDMATRRCATVGPHRASHHHPPSTPTSKLGQKESCSPFAQQTQSMRRRKH